MGKGEKSLNFGLLLLGIIFLVTGSGAQAALEVSFSQEATSLAVGESGQWEVTITNPDSGTVNGAELVVTLPDDFTVTDPGGGSESSGPPHTLTWSGISIPGSGGTLTRAYAARPQCNATNQQQMDALVNPGGISAISSPIEVLPQLITITLQDTSGNSSTPAFLGDTVTWVLTINNDGLGDAVNGADVTFTMGSHLEFVSITSPSGHVHPGSLTPGTAETWNTGVIFVGTPAVFQITGTVIGCDPPLLVNEVTVDYGDGDSSCLPEPRFANASIALEIREPDIAITVTPDFDPMPYCGSNGATVVIDNSGAGPAINFTLEALNVPATWEITNPTNGVQFNSGTNLFTIPDIPAGDSFSYHFDFNPQAGICPVDLSAAVLFSPHYFDECEVLGTEYFPPLTGPVTFSIDGSEIPRIEVEKTGPSSASRGDTVQYTLTVRYIAPAGNPDVSMDITDNYADSAQTGLNEGFVVTDPTDGTDNGDTITWSDTSFSPGDVWTRTITLTAPTDDCAGESVFTNYLTVSGSLDDCRGCPVDFPTAEVSTFINQGDYEPLVSGSSKTVTYQDSAGGQVCRDVFYTTCYTFSNDPSGPDTWSGIVFTDAMANNQSFVSVTEVSVNGTAVDSSCYAVDTSSGMLSIDLSGLDGGGSCNASPPNSGAELCVSFTLHAEENSVGGFIDWSGLSIAGYENACSGDGDYDQGVQVSISRTELGLNVESPYIVETCEITQHKIIITGNDWIGYDSVVRMDIHGNYNLILGDPAYPVAFSNILRPDGTAVSAFDPTGSGPYVWDLGDILPQGEVTFYMTHKCEQDGDWDARIDYNDLCLNDSGSTHFDATAASHPQFLVKGKMFLYMVPEEFTAYTRHPQVTIYAANGGNGAAHNVDLIIDYDLDLEHYSYSIPSGSDTPTVTGNPGDHHIVFHYDSIAAGKTNAVTLTANLIGCENLNVDSTLEWGCSGEVCEHLENNSRVNLSSSDLMISKHFADPVDYCGSDLTINLGLSNIGLTDVYNVKLVELLPEGLTYIDTDAVTYTDGYGALTGAPAVTTQMVGSRQQIEWDFSNVMPLNSESDRAMKPHSELLVAFRCSLADCSAAGAFALTDRQAGASGSYDRPCEMLDGGSVSAASPRTLTIQPFEPHISLVKEVRNINKDQTRWTSSEIDADVGDTLEWRITITSDGDFVAENIVVSDVLPTNVTTPAAFESSTCSSCTPADLFGSGCNIGDLDIGNACEIIYRTTVQDCDSVSVNSVDATYGCCSDEPMLKNETTSVTLRTYPDYQNGTLSISYNVQGQWNTCGGDVQVTLFNSGGTADTTNITVTLPGDYEFDDTNPCTITASNTPPEVTHASFNCTGVSGNTPTWTASNIDFVAPGETITISFYTRLRVSDYCDDTDANNSNDPDLEVPSDSLSVDYNFSDSCGNSYSDSDSVTVDPEEADLDISITPYQQTAPEGSSATWTVVVTNDGSGTAPDNSVTLTFGDGFSNVQYDAGSGMTACSGNNCTFSISDLAPGASRTIQVTADIGSGALDFQAHTEGQCSTYNGPGGSCNHSWDNDYAYVSAFDMSKSVSPEDANVGELLTYHIRAEFSNTDTYINVTLQDTLPPNTVFVSAVSDPENNDSIFGSTMDSTLTWNPGNFNGKAIFHFIVQARIQNVPANGSGTTLVNTFDVDYGIDFDGDSTPELSDNDSRIAQTSVHEPVLNITKTISPDSGLQAGDTVSITLEVSNVGDGPVYNILVADLLNDTDNDGDVDGDDVYVYDCSTVVEGTTPGDFTYSVSAITADDCSVEFRSVGDAAISAGDSRTFVFQVTLRQDFVTGSTYTNMASVQGWSLPPSDSESTNPAYDRNTSDTATDDITGDATVLNSKVLVGSSESDTTDPDLAVGEVAYYRINYEFPAGETRNVTIVDELPEGLEYIPGTAALDRDSTDITCVEDPGGINGNVPGNPVTVTLNNVSGGVGIDLGNISSLNGSHIYTLTLACVVKNIATNNSGTELRDRGRIDWETASGTSQSSSGNYISVFVAEPVPSISKTANPMSPQQGGDRITFELTICNNASDPYAAPSYDWVFADALPPEYENFGDVSWDAGTTGAVITAAFSGNILTGTIDKLDPGECITVSYQADLVESVQYGDTIVNTATFTTTSIPGTNGSDTPGTPGSETGERTGAGGVNDLNGSDNAQIIIDRPTIDKEIITPESWYPIGMVETQQLTIGVPVGTTDNFVVTDVLPEGLRYVDGTQNVTPPTGFTPVSPAFSWDSGSRTLTWDFGTVDQNPPSGNIVITYDVVVENIMGNQRGTTLVNTAQLTYDGGSAGPVSTTMTVGEPNLYMEKTPQTNPTGIVDAGDSIRFRVQVWNNGVTTAYQVDWKDILPDGLFEIDNGTLGLTIVSGDVYLNNTTTSLNSGNLIVGTTTNNNDTISLPLFQMSPGSQFYLEFTCRLMDTVVAGETLTNRTGAGYSSQPTGDETTGIRNGTDGGDDDDSPPTVLNDYNESAEFSFDVNADISIVKTLPGGDDHFTIGEDFAYRLRTWVIEGISPDIEVHDELPAGLSYRSHSITSPVVGTLEYGNPNYNDLHQSGQHVWFVMGDVFNASNQDDSDDFFDVELTSRVDNIAANQSGAVLTNTGYLLWGPGATRVDTGPVEIELTEPDLSVTKTADRTMQSLGDLVTFTVTVSHTGASTSNAYDVVVTDTLPVGLTFESTSVPSADYSVTGQNLEFRRSGITQGAPDNGVWSFTYTVRIDMDAVVGQPLTNSLIVHWASLPGSTGDPDSGRTGDGGVNDYETSDDEAITPTIDSFIDAHKTVSDNNGLPVVPGDVLTYTITLHNTGGAVSGVVFTDSIPTDTTYVGGSLTSTYGTPDDSGNPDLAVDIGDMAADETVTITFQVTVNTGVPDGTEISNQGFVDSDSTVPEPTDADGIDGNGDQPTVIPVGEPSVPPELYLWKFVEWMDDADGSGDISPGDTMRYWVILYNYGQTQLTDVSFTDVIPNGLTYTGSAYAEDGILNITPPNIDLTGMTIDVGENKYLWFEVTIDNAGTFVNQGTGDSNETDPEPTDANGDPSDGDQPTVFSAVDPGTGTPELNPEKRWYLVDDADGNGVVNPGDTIEYFIWITNEGTSAALNVVFTDSIPANTTVVPGSGTTSQGGVVTEDPFVVNIGELDPGDDVVLSFQVIVDAGTPAGTIITNQGTVTGDDGINENTDNDDNDDNGINPNLTPVEGTPSGLTKTLTGTSEADSADTNVMIGEIAVFRVSVNIPAGRTSYASIVDTLPVGLAPVAGTARLARIYETDIRATENPGGINSAASGDFVALTDGVDVQVSSSEITVDLGHIINSDNDANDETYILEFQALVQNISGNDAGISLINQATFRYYDLSGHYQELPTEEVSVTIIEPGLHISKVVDTANIVPGGGSVEFTLTITNPDGANIATGYDLAITDSLPTEFVSMTIDSITPSGGVSGVTDNSSGTTVSVQVDVFPPNGILVIVLTANLDSNLPAGTFSNVAEVTWTSLPGPNGTGDVTPGDSGDADGERNGNSVDPNDYLTSDAAEIAIASLGNYVWYDANADGIQDSVESGIRDVVVHLYWAGPDGIMGTADDVHNQMQTDSNGLYYFYGLPGGNYSVRFEPPSGFTISPQDQSSDDTIDSDAAPATGETTIITLAPGTDDPTWDAGMYEPASIGDYVWYDTNMNGAQDSGEAAVPDVTVNLYDGTGALQGSDTTDTNGIYGFDGLVPGDYFVEFILPANYMFTTQDSGADDADSDADTTTGRTIVTTLEPGENDPTWDAGMFEMASIGDYVWLDENINGIQDSGETGVVGVTVNLYDGTGTLQSTMETGADGQYHFTELVPGDYYVSFILPEGWSFSPQDQGSDDTVDSDADVTTGRTETTTLEQGEDDLTWDAGIHPAYDFGDLPDPDYPVLIASDGARHVIDPAVYLGMTVDEEVDGHPDTDAMGDDTAGTPDDEDGVIFTSALIPGEMAQLEVRASVAGYLNAWIDFQNDGSFEEAGDQIFTDTELSAGVNSLAFSVPEDVAGAGLYARFRFSSDDPEGAMTEYGLWPNGEVEDYRLSTVGDTVWYDVNMNGIQDAGEEGVESVTVLLYSPGPDGVPGGGDDTLQGTATTDATGHYGFLVSSGAYYLSFVLPPNYVRSPQDAGSDDGLDSDCDPETGLTEVFTLEPGENDPTWDAGMFELASIGDYVWYDTNMNGVQDSGEAAVPDVTVNLYDGSGALQGSDITDTNGIYGFDGLVPGDYFVEFILPANYMFSPQDSGADDVDSDADTTTGRTIVTTLEPGENDPSWDAGMFELASIGDYAWYDTNMNGVQDSGEAAVPDVTVNLYNGSGALQGSDTTDSSGIYGFDGLVPGDYFVEFILPANYMFTAQDSGADDADSDADTTTGRTIVTTLEPGENDLTWDAGMFELASIGDYVWYDTNMNGVQDSGEAAVPDVTVNLYDGSGALQGSDTTDSSGIYGFDSLVPGNYFVEFILPANYMFSPQDSGADDMDSDADPATGSTIMTYLEPGENDPTWDAGMFELASIGDYVWYDTNMNGVQDSSEAAVPDVTVNLYDGSGTFQGSDTTDSDGIYGFEGLVPGDYFVEFILPANYMFTVPDSGADDLDSDADPTTGSTIVTTLEPGENDPTWDAGMFELASIGDYVWYDMDMDGIQDGGEPGQPDITVNLYNSDNVLEGTASTDESGYYQFDGLVPGDYFVEFILPANYIFTVQDAGPDNIDSDADTTTGRTDITTLLPGESDLTWDAGIFEQATLGDRVWLDANINGIQDEGEEGVPDVEVNLFTEDGEFQEMTTTGTDGYYQFTNLVPDNYYVSFTLPENYEFSPQDQGEDDTVDSDADMTTGETEVTTLEPGENDPTWDAGMHPYYDFGDLPEIGYPVLIESNGARHVIDTEIYLGNAIDHELNGQPDENVLGDDNNQQDDEDGIVFLTPIIPGETASIQVTASVDGFLNAWFDFGNDGSFEEAEDHVFQDEMVDAGSNLLEFQVPEEIAGAALYARFRFTEDDPSGLLSYSGVWENGEVEDYRLALIGDKVWIDSDMDGIQDTGEPGAEDVAVTIFSPGPDGVQGNEDDEQLGIVQTDAQGNYEFIMPPGSYYIAFEPLPGFDFSPMDQGTDDQVDSDVDPMTGWTTVTTLEDGETDLSWDAGIFVPATPTYTPTPTPTYTPTPSPTPGPDCSTIEIQPWNITFDPAQAQPGDIVTITARIKNIGAVDVDYTEVNFAYERTPFDPSDDPDMVIIGDPVPVTDFAAEAEKIVSVQWDTTGLEAVTYPVYVFVNKSVPEECNPGAYTQTDFTVPVKLAEFIAIPEDGYVDINWTTSTEINNVGFRIYRNETYLGPFEEVTQSLIPGAGTSYSSHEYTWRDTGLTNGIPYFYRLAMISTTGDVSWSPIISAVPNDINAKVLINTSSNRKIYYPGTPLNVFCGIRNPGQTKDIQVQIPIYLDYGYLADIVPPTQVTIDGNTDIDFELLNYMWSGIEPQGDYLILTILNDKETGKLIHVDVTEFNFIQSNTNGK